MDFGSITLAEAGAALAGAAFVVGGLIKVIGWAVDMRREMDSKSTRSECDSCRSSMRSTLEAKAAKAEMDALATRAATQAQDLAVIKAQLSGQGETLRKLEGMLERLLERGA